MIVRIAVVFLALPLSLLSAGAARADTVVLKDGTILQGTVIERGDNYYLQKRLGGLSIPKTDVVKIVYSKKGKKAKLPYDMVFLKDGTIVRGNVKISKDGADVLVGDPKRGGIKHPRAAVERILMRDGREIGIGAKKGTAHLRSKIDKLVKSLSSKEAATRGAARRELLALGVFARSYLESIKGAQKKEVQGILKDLDRLEQVRKHLPRRVENKIRRLAERLISPSATERMAALRTAVLEAPNEVGPLLLHMVKTDAALRAYALGQLSSLRRFVELAQVLKIPNGPLRLAAAFALGDAGIYAGVPILIEALRLKDLEIRTAAINKLREYTKQHFGYRPKSSVPERNAAIKKWNKWWTSEGLEWVKLNIKTTAPTLVGGKVSPEDEKEARKLWLRANKLVAEVNTKQQTGKRAQKPAMVKQRRLKLERALRLLRKALERDPSLSSARMTRAVVLYEEFGRLAAARAELNRLLDRAKHDPGEPDAARKFAHYHLGMIAMLEKLYRKAAVRFSQSLQYDEHFIDALVGQGDAYLALALADPRGAKPQPGDAQKRRRLLWDALKIFKNALTAISKRGKELLEMVKSLTKGATKTLEESQVIQSVRRNRRALELRRAAVLFRMGRVQAARQLDDKALEHYEDALRLAPKNERYKTAVEIWKRLTKKSKS